MDFRPCFGIMLPLLLLLSVAFSCGCIDEKYTNTTTNRTVTTKGPDYTTTTTLIKSVANTIRITASPSEANAGSLFSVSWYIMGAEGQTDYTAIHYGEERIDNPNIIINYPYSSDPLCTKIACDVPGPFSVQMSIPEEGTYYYRAYSIVDGEYVWSEEGTIKITPPFAPTTREYVLYADDNGFYENGDAITSIIVNRKDVVKITITVKDDGVYYNGLDFRGCGTDASAEKGESVTLEFTAGTNCAISSYRPFSGDLKQTLTVQVI